MDIGHFRDGRSGRVSTQPVPLPPAPDTPTTAAHPAGNRLAVVVGEYAEAEQHITLPGIVTRTRSRALRVPLWLLAGHALLTVGGAHSSALVDAVARLLFIAI